MCIYIYTVARAQSLASLRSQAPVFSGISNQGHVSLVYNSSSVYLDTASAPYTSSCLLLWLYFSTSMFSPTTILDLSYSTPSSRLWGRPCTFSSLRVTVPGTSTKSTISYLVSLCLVSLALFSCLRLFFSFIDIFSTHIFLDFSHFTPR